MPLEIVTVPCLADNYAFLLHDADKNQTALVDAPEAAPIENALEERGWGLDMILITHHHYDHVDGVAALKEKFAPQIVGAAADAGRLPDLDIAVDESTDLEFAGHKVHVFDVSGHTVGHIAFYIPNGQAVFTADSLMALGCGRLFEGTPEQMWTSLSKLAALPPETMVYSGHEYTSSNAKFALTVDPDNSDLKKRAQRIFEDTAQGIATVPSKLSDECATNPFLRASDPLIRARLGMQDAPDSAVFAEIRSRKDNF
jgi:hydroxyacylglutathione hydrolase